MVVVPERRTAMHHSQLSMGAVMSDADGWQLPLHFGNSAQESAWLRQTVGVSDVSPLGKVRVVGQEAASTVSTLISAGSDQATGSVVEADSTLERGGKLLSVRLAQDEYVVLAPAGVAPTAVETMRSADSQLAYSVDVTSALCGVAVVGPATQELMSRITELNTSGRALPDHSCVQSRFADVQGLLLRRDVNGIAMYQLYAGREYGEYLWETLIETAHEVGGGPVGTEALLGLREMV